MGGDNYGVKKKLTEIKVNAGISGYRNYILNYNLTGLGYDRLIKITEKSGDNSKSLNPTLFTYADTNNNDLFTRTVSTIGLSNTSSQNSSYISGDFNGDSKMDVIIYPKTGTDAKKKYWLLTDIDDGSYNFPSTHNVGLFQDIFPVSWLNHNSKLMRQQGWAVVKKTSSQYKFNIYIVLVFLALFILNMKKCGMHRHIVINILAIPLQ